MGSVSATSSIDRVLKAHSEDIKRELMEEAVATVKDVGLGNAVYGIQVTWILIDDSELRGPYLDIDDLAEKYPDCEVGY